MDFVQALSAQTRDQDNLLKKRGGFSPWAQLFPVKNPRGEEQKWPTTKSAMQPALKRLEKQCDKVVGHF